MRSKTNYKHNSSNYNNHGWNNSNDWNNGSYHNGKSGGKKGHWQDGGGQGKGKGKGNPGKAQKGGALDTGFRGRCSVCWQMGHKRAQCPYNPQRMDIGAMGQTDQTLTGAPMSSPPPSSGISTASTTRVCGISTYPMIREEDSYQEDWSGWLDDDGWGEWPQSEDYWDLYDWYDEDGYGHVDNLYVCGVKYEVSNGAECSLLMLDSGSQSNACRRSFAPEYDIDDSDKVRLWDIQDSNIRSHGRKIVDITMIGKRSETHNQVKMDVSDVGKDVLSMGRLLRSGYDVHFTGNGHCA